MAVETEAGRITAFTMLEDQAWSVETGADGIGQFSTVDVVGDTIIALTFSVKQG